jgi:hypothetical protein
LFRFWSKKFHINYKDVNYKIKAVLKSEASHLELTRSINLMVNGKKVFGVLDQLIGLLQKKKKNKSLGFCEKFEYYFLGK